MNKKTSVLTLIFCIFFAVIPLFAQNSNNISFVESLQNKLESGDINGAISLYDSIPQNLANDLDLKMLKASLLISAGRYNEASDVTQELAQHPDTQKDALELDAQIATATKNSQKLKTVINQLLALDPYNPTANNILGDQQALRKKYKLAANYYRKALAGDSQNMDSLFGFGLMTYYLGDLKTSRTQFETLLKLDPYNASAWAYMGKLAADEENFLQAIQYIQKAIELESDNYEFYIDLGQYNRSRGKFSDAEKAWTKAIELNPKYFLPYTYRAGLYDEQNRIQEALNDYLKVVETNPKYYFAYEEIGILHFHLENWAEARKFFLKANSVSKQTSYQLMILATYLKEKNLFEAKNFAQTCMKTLDRASIDYLMIRLYHDQGPFNAENAIIKKLDSETDKNKKGKMTYYLALYYELKGSDRVAREYYSQVTKMQTPMFFEYRLAEWGLLK